MLETQLEKQLLRYVSFTHSVRYRRAVAVRGDEFRIAGVEAAPFGRAHLDKIGKLHIIGYVVHDDSNPSLAATSLRYSTLTHSL